ncbi:MAG: hypothetical protein KAH22_09460 [Thiotrichaceae bacterium]|nr:hypothetical protein [Thiotrichaceae bacterium]
MKSLSKLPLKVGLSSFLLVSFLLLGSINAQAKGKTYGPIRSGQTLWVIAYKTRLRGVSRLRMMKALHRYNPQAFDKGNINRLKRGARLKIPTSKKHINRLLSSKKRIATATQVTPSTSPKVKPANDQELIIRLQNDLITIKKELLESRETLKGLKTQETKLEQVRQTVQAAQLASLTTQYASAQQQIKQLQEENTALSSKKTNTTAQNMLSVELSALKKQNSLLQQELRDNTVSANNPADANDIQVRFKETVIALNADIGLLKNRIHELESIEKLKDNHIAQLQQSLDRATVVIKNQAQTNKKIFEQLNALELAQKRQQTIPANAPVVTATNTTPVKQLFPVKSNTQTVVDTPYSLSSSLSQVTPRFWLIITLSVLLLVLALLWRQMFPKEDFDKIT